MSDGLGDTFKFVHEPRREPLILRPKGPSWPSRLKRAVVTIMPPVVVFAGFLGVLSYKGLISIPGHEAPINPGPNPTAIAVAPPGNSGFQSNPIQTPNLVRQPGRGNTGVGQRPIPSPPSRRPVVPNPAPNKPGSLAESRATPANKEDSPKSELGQAEALALLRNQGIVQTPQGFALQSEADAKSKVLQLRSSVQTFNAAYDRLGVIQMAVARMKELNQTIINLDAEIADGRTAMAQFPATYARGRWFHGNNNQENDLYEGYKAEVIRRERYRDTEIRPQRDTLGLERPGQHLAEATEALKSAKDAALNAVSYARDAIAETRRGYDSVANRQDVRTALTGLRQPNLQLSDEFQAAEREFKEIERTAAKIR